MKATGILLAASLLMATQAFACSERKQNVAPGVGAGVLVASIAEMHHYRRDNTTYTYARPRDVTYIYPKHRLKKHHCRKHHIRNERGRRHALRRQR
ncbi:hypothetical protein [Sulfurimonas sp. HSL3-7]|uniref:hypothetical protein n=1 Tax=Sulfonitrofixus jiaomeiensis TaxID=3131938 RepID=UPI0031F7A941